MKYCFLLLTLLFLTGCTTSTPTPSVTDKEVSNEPTQISCSVDTDCTTPSHFLIQSNCPFTSLCIEEQCAVVCPMVFPAENNDACTTDTDCDCSQRGTRSMDCKCVDGACYSVEG